MLISIQAAPLSSDFCPRGSGMVEGSCRCSPVEDFQAVSLYISEKPLFQRQIFPI